MRHTTGKHVNQITYDFLNSSNDLNIQRFSNGHSSQR